MSEGNVMSGSRSAALRKLVRSAVALELPAATDRELLRRFARENDQSAFETLVNRHTAMVFGVCRRALSKVQDAEDACQATFLALASRGRDGRWQESVANWLYATARKVGHNARVAAERRVRRETGAAVPEAVEQVDRMTVRELLSALDEALDRLPSGYREPIVLCYLEGLTRDEAASRLGIPLATLHTRIDRARKRLHEILTKAGCTLGAGLLALTVASPAGASPPHLVQSILANASGDVPAAVGELAKGVAVNGSYTKLVLALSAVAVVALGAGLGLLNTSTASQPPASPASERAGKQPPKDAAAKPAQKEVTLTGRVLNPDGQPLAGAKLFAGLDRGMASRVNPASKPAAAARLFEGRFDELKEVGTTGVDGKFTVKVPAGIATNLIARVEGVGLDFLFIPADRLGEEIELRTVKDHPVRGRILDTQGKPVVGAIVAVSKLDVCIDNFLDGFLADFKRSGHLPMTRKSLSHEAGVFSPARTDKDGRFTIEGVGVERVVTLRVSGAGLAETEVLAFNRMDFDPKPYNEVKPARASASLAPVVFHGSDGTVVVETEKRIHGTVADVDTGKPCAGAKVTLVRNGSTGATVLPHLSAVTDAEGKYEIHGVRKSPSYAVAVASDAAARYFTARVRVNDTAGYEPVAADLKVKKGVIVTGKVIDTGTKVTVRGFASIAILKDNKFVKEYPEFDARPNATVGTTVATDEDGAFRIVTIPGPVLLADGHLASDHFPDPVVLTRYYKIAAPDPKYPQSFSKIPFAQSPNSKTPRPPALVFRDYYNYMYPLAETHFCKVLEIKADAETVVQDILLEPVLDEPKKDKEK